MASKPSAKFYFPKSLLSKYASECAQAGYPDYYFDANHVMVFPTLLGDDEIKVSIVRKNKEISPEDFDDLFEQLRDTFGAKRVDAGRIDLGLSKQWLLLSLEGMVSELTPFECIMHNIARNTMGIREIHAAVGVTRSRAAKAVLSKA